MVRILLFIVGITVSLTQQLHSFVKPQHDSHFTKDSFEIRQIILKQKHASSKKSKHLESYDASYTTKHDLVNNQIRLITGDFGSINKVNPTQQDFTALAHKVIKENTDIFQVSIDDLSFVEDASYIGKDVQFIKFSVSRKGVPIKNAEINFRFKQQKLVQILNYSYGEVKETKETELDHESLKQAVIKETQAIDIKEGLEFYRIIQEGKDYSLKKVISYNISTANHEDLSVQILKSNAKIYEIKNNHFYLEGKVQADLYPRWYEDEINKTNLAFLSLILSDGQNIQTDDQGLFRAGVDAYPKITQGLKGKYIHINDIARQPVVANGEIVDDEWNIQINQENSTNSWLDKLIAQNMVYHHINEMVLHAKKYISPRWFDSSLQANTNLNSTCNAHWDGRTINLYSGSNQCANTGLIADVIYHEWGHGLDANTGGIQDGAFSEGIGDIMSMLMTRSNILGIGFRVPSHAPVRDLEPNKRYPEDTGEVHAEGLIIGSTFWDLFKALRDMYDEEKAVNLSSKYIFKAIYTARSYTDVYDALLVIDDDDNNLENGTPHLCTLNSVFTEHGLADKDQRCLLASVEEYEILDSDEDGVLEPGEHVKLNIRAKNPSSNVLTKLKGTLKILESDIIEMENPNLIWNSIRPQQSKMSDTYAEFTISDKAQCGSSFTSSLTLSANQQSILSQHRFFIGKNQGQAQSHLAQDLPADILDHQTTTSSIDIDSQEWQDGTKIANAHLSFNIDHSYIGDLTVILKTPSGQDIEVYKGQGAADNVNYEKNINEHVKDIEGGGTWTLMVHDRANRDQGVLKDFKLELTPSLFVCD